MNLLKETLVISLIKYLQYPGRIYSKAQFLKNSIKVWKNTFEITLGLSFVWPTKILKLNIDKSQKLSPTIVETADNIFEKGRYEECYNFLMNCKDLDNIEVKWRLSRVMYNMAKDPKYKHTYQKALIEQAYDILFNDLNKHSDNYAVHKWYALTLDAKSSNEGYKKKIEELNEVKRHMDIAIKLNPNDASLLHMLGEMCYQVTDMPWHQRITAEALYAKLPHYNYEDALEYFLKAETVHPRFYSVNLLRLGCCYLKVNKVDQAKYYLKLAASYPAKSNDDHRAKKEAAELLKKIK